MNNESIPAIAYGFVGITALVLTYVTITDTEASTDNTQSATSMLPTLESFTQPTTPSATSVPPVIAEPIPESLPVQEITKPNEGAVGGKKIRHKGGKKSRIHKEEKKKQKRSRRK